MPALKPTWWNDPWQLLGATLAGQMAWILLIGVFEPLRQFRMLLMLPLIWVSMAVVLRVTRMGKWYHVGTAILATGVVSSFLSFIPNVLEFWPAPFYLIVHVILLSGWAVVARFAVWWSSRSKKVSHVD